MKVSIPPDLATEPERVAYRRGWRDRGAKSAAKAGRATSEAKAAAARANGAKGGRPLIRRRRPAW
jgi:hypothetical protein